MADPYVGEIRMFGGNFAPVDWAFCNGQLLSIGDYSTLFQLIGTTYGGDGQSTFGLPNLQGRLPIHLAPTHPLGQSDGTENVTLNSTQIPVHDHPFNATTNGASVASPSGALPASGIMVYKSAATNPGIVMSNQSIGPAGGNQPHDNMMPSLAVSFIISLFGIYPSQS